jgi:hypothetical protein
MAYQRARDRSVDTLVSRSARAQAVISLRCTAADAFAPARSILGTALTVTKLCLLATPGRNFQAALCTKVRIHWMVSVLERNRRMVCYCASRGRRRRRYSQVSAEPWLAAKWPHVRSRERRGGGGLNGEGTPPPAPTVCFLLDDKYRLGAALLCCPEPIFRWNRPASAVPVDPGS